MADALESMRALRREIEDRLLTNPDYRALVSLDRAISEAGGAAPLNALAAPRHQNSLNGMLRNYMVHYTPDGEWPFSDQGKLSQADAAFAVLKAFGRPMTTAELIEPVRQQGATLGGDEPAVNLSSSLSRDKERFQSLRWNRKSCWWFKDIPPPPEPDDEEFDTTLLAVAATILGSRHGPLDPAELAHKIGTLMGRRVEPFILVFQMNRDPRFVQVGTGWTMTAKALSHADQGSRAQPDASKKGEVK